MVAATITPGDVRHHPARPAAKSRVRNQGASLRSANLGGARILSQESYCNDATALRKYSLSFAVNTDAATSA